MSKKLLKNGWKGVTTINNNLFNIIGKKHCIISYKAGHSFKYRKRTKGKSKNITRKKLPIFMLITQASSKDLEF